MVVYERLALFGKVGFVKEKEEDPRGFLRIKEFSSKGEEAPEAQRGPLLKAVGRWILWPEVFRWLEKTRPEEGEWDETPALQILCHKGKVLGIMLEGEGFDLGNPLGYRACNFLIPP
ncbi:MAG: hypothetical protein ACK42E_05595 [Candidatus Bipolaricaulaceae bacterium]